jgi:chemotaxis protein methyltransferase CheR
VVPWLRLSEIVKERFGIKTESLQPSRVDGAVSRAVSVLQVSPDAAVDWLATAASDDALWQDLIELLLVRETSFFRHNAWFASLEEEVLTPLIATKRAGAKRLNVWSAGCATGEEPYSIAIALDQLLRGEDWEVRIIGTDVNERALASARIGRYRAWALREVDAALRARYFTEVEPDVFEIAKSIREKVSFYAVNLVDTPGIANIDLLVCRNVLIYLTPDHQTALARRLAECLAFNGWLAVAPVEANSEWFPGLRPLRLPSAIFFQYARTGDELSLV